MKTRSRRPSYVTKTRAAPRYVAGTFKAPPVASQDDVQGSGGQLDFSQEENSGHLPGW